MRIGTTLFAIVLLLQATSALAQTGTIAGRVTDAATGQSLPGVNVAIDGTTQGSITDADGYYTIIGVRPGTYAVRASFVGFTPELQEDVRVMTGLATTVNFGLREQVVGLDEVIVAAERPIVQRDVSSNVANLNPADFQDLPVAGVSEVIDLQAGIEPGTVIRGGGLGQVAFVVDGMNTRTGRDQTPITNISYTSLEEVQVQTGGFSAEYGNVRAGLINVTTKEPSRTRYTFDGLVRYVPPQEKAFDALGRIPESCDYSGASANTPLVGLTPDCDSFWVRPLLDSQVNMEGTAWRDGAGWDRYTREEYQPFAGWNAVTENVRARGFDVNQQDMIDYFKHAFRKDNTIDVPDYDVDMSLAGPLVPGLSQRLGGLRFLASYRGTQTAYLHPQTAKSYQDNTFQGKLVSDVGPGMKFSLHGMILRERGQTANADDPQIAMWRGNFSAYPWQNTTASNRGVYQVGSYGDGIRADFIYTDGQMALAEIDHDMIGAQFVHTLNPRTFYEVKVQRVSSKYRSKFPNLRDGSYICPSSGQTNDGQACVPGDFVRVMWTDNMGNVIPGHEDKVTCFGGGNGGTPYCVGTEMLGFAGQGGNLETGPSTGGHWTKTRDNSEVDVWSGRFDLTSQVNRYLMVKTGAELIYSDYDISFQSVNLALVGPEPGQDNPWARSPIQGAAYTQARLDFQGMVANVGLRLDYFDANTDWWVFDPYDVTLRFRQDVLDDMLPKESVSAQATLSPRLGVSFPITANSKLFFNYGHFRQMLEAERIFGVQQSLTAGIQRIGNPSHPMPKTVAYELGYDQNIFDQFLLTVSGFYRDISDQFRGVNYVSLGNISSYTTEMPWSYGDNRGFEVSLSKTRGDWIRGFANYTYLQRKSGNFGFSQFRENSFEMLNYLRDSEDYRQSVPVAEPFARANAILIVPRDFGPSLGGANPLGDWRVSLMGEWRKGQTFTWFGQADPNIRNNVNWKDAWMFDLRLTKYLNTTAGSMQLFMDVDNVFNIRQLRRFGSDIQGVGRDQEDYMRSLHLPADVFDQMANPENAPYIWVPGNDTPGDYRKIGAEWQPIEARASLPTAPPEDGMRAWYWTQDTESYWRYEGGSWQAVPDSEVKKVLDDKAYINMPNLRFRSFLNPRTFRLGLRLAL